MKNNIAILTLLVLLTSLTATSQRRKLHQLPNFDKYELHWGFYLGMNFRDFKINYKESDFPNANITLENQPGFNVGLIGDMRINENFNLRFEPGLSSNSSTLHFINKDDPTVFNTHTSAEISSTYLHLPFLIKISADRLNNIKPYLIAGFSYDHNFSSNSSNPDDNFNSEFRMQTQNFMYEIGFGADFYFHYFKFSPSIRGQFAFTNEIRYDNAASGPSPWTDPIEFMGSRGVFLKFSFE